MNWKEHELIKELEDDVKLPALYFLSAYDRANLSEEKKKITIMAVIEIVRRYLVSGSYYNLVRMYNDNGILSTLRLKAAVGNMVGMLEKGNGVESLGPPIKYTTDGHSYLAYIVDMLDEDIKTSVREKVYFVPHCNESSCDLGTLETMCLYCNKPLIDYDGWWKQEEVLKGEEVVLKCYRCGRTMLMKQDANGAWLKRAEPSLAPYADLALG